MRLGDTTLRELEEGRTLEHLGKDVMLTLANKLPNKALRNI
jgi:hypothetical protein